MSVDPEDIGRNNGFHNSDNISIGHFKPIVSDRYLSDLHEYIFHFTKNGNVKLEKLKIGVTYQDKTNIGRWKTATRDRRDRGNVWFIPYPTVQEANHIRQSFQLSYLNAAYNYTGSRRICLFTIPS